MNTQLFFSWLSILVYICGITLYIYHSIRWKIIPHPFTWFIGMLFISLNILPFFENSTQWSLAVVPLFLRFTVLMVWSLIGFYKISRLSLWVFDYFLLFCAALILILMKLYSLNEIIFLIIGVDFIAALPTVKKIILSPETEWSLIWFTTALSIIFFLFSLDDPIYHWSIFWYYSILLNLSIGLLVLIRQSWVKIRIV